MSTGIPEEMIAKLQKLDSTITSLEESLDKIIEGGVDKHYQRGAHDMALVDVMSMLVMDSLTWAVHGIRGEAADKNDDLQVDLARTKRMTAEIKEVNLRQDAPRINQQAAANFVRNALWEVPQKDETPAKSKSKK